MKSSLKRKLAMLPVVALSAWADAEPVLLDISTMDRITAGSQPVLERLANILIAAPGGQGNFQLGELLPLPAADRLALFATLASTEPIAFHQLKPGELVAVHQLPSGEQVVFVKQINVADGASPAQQNTVVQQNSGEQVKTYFLNPGESLRLQQVSSDGVNRLYVYSTGNSTVTTSQKSGM